LRGFILEVIAKVSASRSSRSCLRFWPDIACGLFFLAISFVVVAFVNSKLTLVIKNTPLNQTDAASTIISASENLTYHGIQKAFVFLFVFMIIGMLISSVMFRVHPIWIIFYILLLGIAVFALLELFNKAK
jgi:hypothetical protein